MARWVIGSAAAVGVVVLVGWLAVVLRSWTADLRAKAALDPEAERQALEAELATFEPEAPKPTEPVGRPIDAPSLVPPAWRAPGAPNPEPRSRVRPSTPSPRTSASVPSRDEAVHSLRQRQLTIPVRGVEPTALIDSYTDPRSGGRTHHAIDISAPHGTPVVAVEAGRVARLFRSRLGGIAIDLVDSTGTYLYYYAHLDDYADGLRQGDPVARGQILGRVGTTGNAPTDAPHLHFAIRVLPGEGSRSRGLTINPYDVLRAGVPAR